MAVDSFEGFTVQEMRCWCRSCAGPSGWWWPCAPDGLDRTGTGLFALVDRTRHRLAAAAQEWGVPVGKPVELTGAPRFQNENLKLVEAQLFCAQEALTSPDSQGITVFEAGTPTRRRNLPPPPSGGL